MKLLIAGQAIYEGVMLCSRNFASIAVRLKDGSIATVVTKARFGGLNWHWMKVPLVRGLIALCGSVACGLWGLHKSLELLGRQSHVSSRLLFIVEAVLGLSVSFILFFVVPHLLTGVIGHVLFPAGDMRVRPYGIMHFALNLIEGFMRAVVFVGFIVIARLFPEVRSYFAYHGAEHKAINAYEGGYELTIDGLMPQPRLHDRCGTSFVLTVFVVAIILFSLLPWTELSVRLIGRLLLLPAVASISYEIILVGISKNASWAKLPMVIGLQIQHLTTAEPSEQQLEVALMALTSLLQSEGVMNGIKGAVRITH